MENWYKYFDERIIRRGEIYYEEGRVSLVSKIDNEYNFLVDGENDIYDVKISKNKKSYDFTCNCKYFEGGGNCKHIVAALKYIENESEDNAIKNLIENPFVKNDGKYRYYDIGKITKDLLFPEKEYEKAKKIIEKKQYKDFKIYISKDERYDFNNAICNFLDKRYDNEVSIVFDNEKIADEDCSHYDCRKYYKNKYNYYYSVYRRGELDKRKVCCHVIALLMLMDKYFEENIDMFDSTSNEGREVLEQIKANTSYIKNLPILVNNQKLGMEIQFLYDDGNLYVNFRIGYDKKYVINNIKQFLLKMDANESMQFGTKTCIQLSEDNLSEEAKELYNILNKNYKRMESAFEYYNNSHNEVIFSIAKNMAFAGQFADELFQYLLSKKEKINIDNKHTKCKYYSEAIMKDYTINTTINDITKKLKGENGILVNVEFNVIFSGIDYIYFLDKNYNLCCCKKEKIKLIEDIISYRTMEILMSPTTKVEFVYGRNKISDFYNDVLPVLSAYGNVKDNTDEKIKSNIKNKTTYLFKIDYDNFLLCKLYKSNDDGNSNSIVEVKENLDYEEKDILLCVKKYFPIYEEKSKTFKSESTVDEMYYILGVVLPYYMQIGDVEISENIKKLQKPKTVSVKVGVSVKSNLIDLKIDSNELSKDEIEDILLAYNKKVKYYKAKNNDIIDIENSDLEILNKLENVTGLKSNELLAKNISLPLYRSLYLDELLKEKNKNEINRDEKFNNLIDKFEIAKNTVYELPKSVNAKLRKYQKEGYQWIKTLDEAGFCGILADEMGLGKTLQVILYFASLYENNEKDTSIVIAPASLIYNWKHEFEKFAPNLKVIVIEGMQGERKKTIDNIKNYNIVITSYDLFKRDIDMYTNINYRCMVIDEAQYIKNQTTKVSKSTKVINSQFRIALTGTPIENRLSELWSIFDFLMPDYLYNYNKFRKNFELAIVRDDDEEKLATIRRMVSPFILRRKKEDVLKDLPEKIENNYYVQMNESQSKLYNAEATKLKKMIMTSDYDNDKIVILSQITKLRQICCDPSLVYDNYKQESSKKDSCISLIQTAIEDGHKILLFSQFTTMLDIFVDELKKVGINYYMITGKTNKNERVILVDKFNNDDVPVFLISLKAGGTGLNLIGADTVIHYDPWWNTSVQNQATDRAHRIGQKKIVNIYKLIAKNTIEEKIIEMQKMKDKISSDILDGEFTGLSKLSKEELLDMINIES